jgi:hypothetical protein
LPSLRAIVPAGSLRPGCHQGKAEGEAASTAGLALDLDLSAELLHDAVDDAEPQPRATLGRAGDPDELLEHVLLELARDAGALVPDPEADLPSRIGAAELLTVRDLEDRLIALGCDIVGERTRHLYYGVSDHESFPGIGTVTMGWSWERFMESSTQTAFSFGRGSERYKYQYVNHDVELFELRGFPACA